MKPFLESIASIYLEKHKSELKEYCFIFPNRRSGVFFKKYLTDLSPEYLILPEITTISDFITGLAQITIPSNLELIMSLYEEYQELLNNEGVEPDDFDKFLFWGNMILSDFNDVDRYLADAEKIFLNVKDYKEISSNFLTEDQIKILSILGYKNTIKANNDESFWNNCSEIKKSFINIWEILFPLYIKFNERLTNEGKAYSGRAYKLALQNLKLSKPDTLIHKKYIFIGFNMLSESEKLIFQYFKENSIGDFYWDSKNIFFRNESNKGAKFISKYVELFPSDYNIESDENCRPNINILSAPSNALQAKCASEIINELISKNKVSSINTAIVIPDEELFIPTLSSVINKQVPTNITYGFPLKFASNSSLVSSLTSLQNRAKKEIDDWTFFHEDVKNVLSHPYLKSYEPKGIKSFLNLITEQKRYRIPYREIRESLQSISLLFEPLIDLEDRSIIFDYLHNIIKFSEDLISGNKFELELLNSYKKTLTDLSRLTDKYQFKIKGNTYLYLVENILSSQTIQFEGEPLKGIQIMGVLETRCLDFENLIILSMNEKVFPKKHFQKSFIPNNLRKAYHLSTIDHQESIFSYYFYRLISKSKNVNLIYDSRTQGVSSGEPSRYIYQIKYLYNNDVNLSFGSYNFNLKSPTISGISITKDADILNKLQAFKNKDSNKYLSASSIYKYIKCPLSFYLSKIENIHIDEEPSNFIEANTFGQIIHDTLKGIYTSDTILSQIEIDKIITYYINQHYLKRKEENRNEDLDGEAILIADVIKYYIDNILIYDGYKVNGKFVKNKSELPFEIIQCEKEEKDFWNLNKENEIDNDLTINFKQFIDRVDRLKDNGRIRIIDYKTGDEIIKLNSISSIFDKHEEKSLKGVFQLFIYSNFYSYLNKIQQPIEPLIYKIRNIKNQKEKFSIKIGKTEIEDFNEFNEEFMQGLRNVITEIFNPEIPFSQTEIKKNCEFCEFKMICQR